ncbi:uncharacterized protein VDAG_02196 [Verticillium dahliae VdLs.17]|uniref:Uncharacterized protein n=2 Tax=Verticillium dahliae TaxID=27337 RepID=G2WV55_VERDV|nr:uncharacterized protein VDAG_02196 [Verticillium dahliae VdLs.17]EGY20180.1 hypothetical protein VDAG_02196 [Verticillium dahliae VdLs.17]KAH6690026.1 hypothetical protein EV126DRAFT_391559 [Verticillium dahliae]
MLIETGSSKAGADGITLLKNQNDVLLIEQGSAVAMIGQHSWSDVLGGGSARVDALHAIPPVQGFRNLVFTTFEARGVPVFGAVPHADPSIVFPRDRKTVSSRPVKVKWFNGPIVGTNLAHEETIPQAEYMIKENTGRATLNIDSELVFDRRKETKLRSESFYFFKQHLERGAATESSSSPGPATPPPSTQHRSSAKCFQGSAVRFHEEIGLARAGRSRRGRCRYRDRSASRTGLRSGTFLPARTVCCGTKRVWMSGINVMIAPGTRRLSSPLVSGCGIRHFA